MSRSTQRTLARSRAVLVLVLVRSPLVCLALLAWLAPSAAWAVTPYSLDWLRTQSAGSCETADLGEHDGEPFFAVNDTPLPTYQVPGALVQNADGSQTNVVEAPFDSVLLRVGVNGFRFAVFNETGDDTCVLSRELVHLTSVPLGVNKPLFDILRDGKGFDGKTEVNLSLAEINPPLAQSIANLEAVLEADQAKLLANAAVIQDLAGKLDTLRQLDTELHALVNRPLDQITTEELDAILDRYGDLVSLETRAALHQVIEDLQKSLDDLHAELASLLETFGERADATADLVTAVAAETGFNPDDPSSYLLDSADVPPVAIPDVSGVSGAFDPANDPYDAYATAVVEALAENVSGGQVTDRPGFVAQVRAFRANAKAISDALTQSNASQAETSAFLNAQNKVVAYVQKFMDAQDWFNDSPVPADVRSHVAGVFKTKFDKLADDMKDALNSLPTTDAIDLTTLPVFDTIRAFGGAMSAIDTVATPYFEMMATLVHATTRVGIGFVPVVGPALDLCEAVTGRAWCLPDGEELSTEERIFSGAGVAAGSLGKFWGGAKNAGIGPKGAAVAGVVAKVPDDVGGVLHAQALAKPAKFRGAMKALPGPGEGNAVKHMRSLGEEVFGIGDDGVRVVLGMAEDSQAPDMLSRLADGKWVFTEVKWVMGDTKNLAENVIFSAAEQLKKGVQAFKAKPKGKLASYVRLAVPEGTKLPAGFSLKNGYLYKDAKPYTVEGLLMQVLEVPPT